MATTPDAPKVKATNDAYTGMLAVSLFALLLGCAVLYLDYSQYEGKSPGKSELTFKPRSASPDWPAAAPKDKSIDEIPPDVKDDPGKDNPDKDNPDKKGGR